MTNKQSVTTLTRTTVSSLITTNIHNYGLHFIEKSTNDMRQHCISHYECTNIMNMINDGQIQTKQRKTVMVKYKWNTKLTDLILQKP